MKSISQRKLSAIREYMLSEGYFWNYDFHIVGIRTEDGVSTLNGLEDRCILVVDGEVGYEFKMNTRPYPIMLQTGQYTYSKAKHFVYYGQQRFPVIMKDTITDMNIYDEYEPTFFGVQLIFHPLHFIWPFSTKSVLSDQAMGSQIISPQAYKMYKKHATEMFTYTLIDEKELSL